LWLSTSCSFFHHYRVSVLTKPVRPICRTGQTGMCVQKLNLVILSSFILVLGLFLFLRTYAWFVHLSSQEKQKSCLPEDQVSNTMRRGRRAVGMWMLVKEALETLLYEDQQEQQHIGIFQGVVWTLIWKLKNKSR
jgi:hypothetical protein